MERLPNETIEEYLDRLDKKANHHLKNINDAFAEMKDKGIIGFCSECGCNKYKNIEHKCD